MNIQGTIEKNAQILDQLYSSGKIFLVKEDLIKCGFDFSLMYPKNMSSQEYDVEEMNFHYRDFACGKYFVKTRDMKAILKAGIVLGPSVEHSRLVFQVVKFDLSDEVMTNMKRATELLRIRKYAAGSYWAYVHDSEMSNDKLAIAAKKQLDANEQELQKFQPTLNATINDLMNTCEYLKLLCQAIDNVEGETEIWQ